MNSWSKFIYFNSGYREEQVKQLQEEYGYSHDDASKVFEIQEYKAT